MPGGWIGGQNTLRYLRYTWYGKFRYDIHCYPHAAYQYVFVLVLVFVAVRSCWSVARAAPGGLESLYERDSSAAAQGRSYAAGRRADAVEGQAFFFFFFFFFLILVPFWRSSRKGPPATSE